MKKDYEKVKNKVEACSCKLLMTQPDFIELRNKVERLRDITINFESVCKHTETMTYKTFMKYNEPILCKKCPSYILEDGTEVISKNVLLAKNVEMVKTDGYNKKHYNELEEKVKICSSILLTKYEEFCTLNKDVSDYRTVQIKIKMTCSHEETFLYRTLMDYKIEPIVCDTCSKFTLPDGSITLSKKLYGNSITSYDNYIKVFKESGCIISTKLEEYMELRKVVDNGDEINVKYVAQCGHENEIQIKSFLHQNCGRKCYKCLTTSKIIGEDGIIEYGKATTTKIKNSFKGYQKFFLDEGCIITSSEEEFIELRKEKNADHSQNVSVDYIAKCGHETEIVIHSFKYDGCGRNCQDCNINSNKNEDRSSKTIKMEDLSIEYMISILKNDFEIKKNISGCLSDFVMRPLSIKEDKWLMIQQKTTDKPRPNKYKFHVNKDYIDCIICCLCLEDKKMWLFNGNEVEVNHGIAIGRDTSIHSSYEVNINTITNKLIDFYNNSVLFTFSETNIPISVNTQKEQEFRVYRELMCEFLNFEYSDLSGLVYDFTINGKKFQEKVGHYKDNLIVFNIFKSNGGKKFKRYNIGDNNYYWLHYPDKLSFLLIPEKDLLNKQNLLKTSVSIIKDSETSKWSKYLFKYDTIDKDKFFKICNNI